jgi:predicted nucleic-acid-binding protein
MIGLDTNVLVRYIMQGRYDSEAESFSSVPEQRARRRLI